MRRSLRKKVKLRVDNGVWYLRVPKILRELGRIPEILNWEIVIKPHPSGNPLLAEITYRPVVRNRVLLEEAADETL